MDFKQTTSVITGGCKKALGLIADDIKASTKLKQQQQLQIQQQLFHNRCEIASAEIQQELFCAFDRKKYPLLHTIEVPGNILPLAYQVTPQGVLFQFDLLAKEHPTPEIFYQQIKAHMQQNIREYQQIIAGTDLFTFNMAMSLHPYIMCGLYIMDVKADGAYMRITVATNYFPSV